MKTLRLICAFEDRAYEDVVVPLVRRVAAEEGVEVDLAAVEIVHGCRFKKLERILRDRRREEGLWIIGADARDRSIHRKQEAMADRLGRLLQGKDTLYAIAKPSAEGWIQADLAALKEGVAEALETDLTFPPHIPPYPEDDEKQAKQRLGSILGEAGVPTLRQGLEYGPDVMKHVRFETEASMATFVGDLRRYLKTGRAE